MYIIKTDNNEIYAGVHDGFELSICYSSNKFNMRKPKVFKTKQGAEQHMNKLIHNKRFLCKHDFKIEEWGDKDLKKHLISIGIDPIGEQIVKQVNEKEKYWKRIFRPIKGELEVTKVTVNGNVCTITYLMPYSTYEHEFFFQADLDKEIVIKSFYDAVIQQGRVMCQQIEESTHDVINLF